MRPVPGEAIARAISTSPAPYSIPAEVECTAPTAKAPVEQRREEDFRGLLAQAHLVAPKLLFAYSAIPGEVLLPGIAASARIVFAHLLRIGGYNPFEHRLRSREVTPRIATLATRTGLPPSTVKDALHRLAERKLVSIEVRPRRASSYELHLPRRAPGLQRRLAIFDWLALTGLTPEGVLVYATFAQAMEGSAVAWLSYSKIATRAGLARGTVIRHVKTLRRDGWIETHHDDRGCTVYLLLPRPDMTHGLRSDAAPELKDGVLFDRRARAEREEDACDDDV